MKFWLNFCNSFVDIVSGRVVNEWVLPVQAIKGYKVSEDNRYIFVGSDTGLITVLDYRSGNILNQWKAHDSTILKVSRMVIV